MVKNSTVIWIIIVIVIATGVGYFFYQNITSTSQTNIQLTENTQEQVNTEEGVVCPQDEYVCPYGGLGEPDYPITVKRIPPTCEFAPCPG